MASCIDKNPTESDETELYYRAYRREVVLSQGRSESRTLHDTINWSPCPHYAALGFLAPRISRESAAGIMFHFL
ncbi:hypothetical protein ACP4OV_002185 [Aristida adscensionis]